MAKVKVKVPSNPWAPAVNLESKLEECLTKDFERLITAYVESNDRSFETFCTLAKTYGITLCFHWCAPHTTKKACHTQEYADKIKYLILQTAKAFWLCSAHPGSDCRRHPGNGEARFWRQVGGLFLVHLLYGCQPSLPDQMVKIDVGVDEIRSVEHFGGTCVQRGTGKADPEKEFYEGLLYIYTRLKVEGALRPTVLKSEIGLSLLNFKS